MYKQAKENNNIQEFINNTVDVRTYSDRECKMIVNDKFSDGEINDGDTEEFMKLFSKICWNSHVSSNKYSNEFMEFVNACKNTLGVDSIKQVDFSSECSKVILSFFQNTMDMVMLSRM